MFKKLGLLICLLFLLGLFVSFSGLSGSPFLGDVVKNSNANDIITSSKCC